MRLSQKGKCVDDGDEAPNVTYLCTVQYMFCMVITLLLLSFLLLILQKKHSSISQSHCLL